MRLTEQEMEALFTAGDHHPEHCDCDAYVIEQAFAEDCCCVALTDTFAAVEAIVARHVNEALREFADTEQPQMAEAWGGNAAWFTTGEKVAAVVCDWLREGIHDTEEGL